MVTSFDMMEGKTTVLTNLGVAAAERKQRVLLIDGDLRRPRLHEVIDALQSELTRRYASGEANVDELLSERE